MTKQFKAPLSIETRFERGLFMSRWLLAPFYAGLVGSLLILLYGFLMELVHLFMNLPSLTPTDAVLGALSLIDMSLAANLVLMVIFSGYENFVSKMDLGNHEDQAEWHGNVDFSGLKLKLVASIVAISGIHLLKIFMNLGSTSEETVKWSVIIHLVFVFSGVMLAAMDTITSLGKAKKKSAAH